ncbi:TPA: hypothetical protein JBL19_04170 [Legionella pneumophila]|nr:hypothetical protein [Legionella pneumophila]MDW8880640.1 hypothetical protein [Legionella pneumophila subsp. fraseri]MDW8962256.1 hypothetical protein [Legionella pneumophila subsp. fraseri]MDW9034750.1 hypothetical protein [Legionella pneumophila subsp. fraseri]MDW9037574.1 hypothetical protein [Legionella pneumophila subsp. fraseri]MDW9040871.1 hypothetical protein [Legionella pneumophila subsp. fraseri]
MNDKFEDEIDLKLMDRPKAQANCFAKIVDDPVIAAMQLNYAGTQINLTQLDEEDKQLKLNNAQQIVESLADSLGAQGMLQNMLVTQLLGVHELQQKLLPYARRSMRDPEHGQYYINAIAKLSNVFIQQASLLHKLQGNSQQKVVVEHLHINEGGQAIVGQVNTNNKGAASEK